MRLASIVLLSATVANFSAAEPPKEAPSKYLRYETKAQLRLPFGNTWLVVWGGRTLEENQHAVSRDQRFALDLVVVAQELAPGADPVAALASGMSHHGDGSRNENYYCHGRPILAPGNGVVVALKDGVPENVPGQLGSDPPGNYIAIDHGNREFSMLAHLIPGSLIVGIGDRVTAGQPIAACGNSGRSSEPHLHYHLQSSARWFDGDGLPAQFQNYVADGKIVARGEPGRGQLIQAIEGRGRSPAAQQSEEADRP